MSVYWSHSVDKNYKLLHKLIDWHILSIEKFIILIQYKREDIIEIGKPWSEKINITKNLGDKQLKIIFSNIHGGSKDPYWENTASNFFLAI